MEARVARATRTNLRIVLSLIDEAAVWLQAKDTDQWSAPWPNRRIRDGRVRRDLQSGRTWIVWDGLIPAATVTLSSQVPREIWQEAEADLSEPAVYLDHLVVARDYAGRGLGAQLVDGVGLSAHSEYGAKWIRINILATNAALHQYFKITGFEPCGFSVDPGYSSGVLFQKPVVESNRFRGVSESGDHKIYIIESDPSAVAAARPTATVGSKPDFIKARTSTERFKDERRQRIADEVEKVDIWIKPRVVAYRKQRDFWQRTTYSLLAVSAITAIGAAISAGMSAELWSVIFAGLSAGMSVINVSLKVASQGDKAEKRLAVAAALVAAIRAFETDLPNLRAQNLERRLQQLREEQQEVLQLCQPSGRQLKKASTKINVMTPRDIEIECVVPRGENTSA
jgi:GNAT superfamily N-acetyltransferase